MMFEEWAARLDYSLEGTAIKGRRYSSENTEQAFRGWNAAIEEAAKACEALYLEHDCKHPTDYANGMMTASDVLEQRIRALKS